MQIWFIISLLFAIFVAFFALLNSDPVSIRLLWKTYEFSQAIVILGSAAGGAIIVAFLGVFRYIGSGLKIREFQNKVKKLEKEKDELLSKLSTLNQGNEEIMNNNVVISQDEKIEMENENSMREMDMK